MPRKFFSEARPIRGSVGDQGNIMQCGRREPSLNELMQEPIVVALMQRDAVQESELRRLLAQVGDAYHADAVPHDRLN
jgi:hypothetical protein